MDWFGSSGFRVFSFFNGVSETNASSGKRDETTKKGLCLLELRDSGMVQWGDFGKVLPIQQGGQNNSELLSTIVKEEQKEDENALAVQVPAVPVGPKRKHLNNLGQLREAKAARHGRHSQTSSFYMATKIKQENSTPCAKRKYIPSKSGTIMGRWSKDRYKHAMNCMFEVLKAKGAVYENPISRPALRVAARMHIGDTGLLDHIMSVKHIDGKVTASGTERVRVCYNTEGVMQYWLESADLVAITSEDCGLDLNWVPPSCWKPSGVTSQDSVFAGELKPLKDEIEKMKRDVEDLASKIQVPNQASPNEGTLNELVNWKGTIDQRLMEISSSLSDMKDMFRELVMWKSKTELRLTEISSSLRSMQESKQCTTCSPDHVRWEDWLESSNLDGVQGDDFPPWLESSMYPVNVGPDASLQEPCFAEEYWLHPCDGSFQDPGCARELVMLKEGMTEMKGDVQEQVPKEIEKDKANVTPDSSVTVSSKPDLDNSFLFQEMLKEFAKWKNKMEEQMIEIANSVRTLQASKLYTI